MCFCFQFYLFIYFSIVLFVLLIATYFFFPFSMLGCHYFRCIFLIFYFLHLFFTPSFSTFPFPLFAVFFLFYHLHKKGFVRMSLPSLYIWHPFSISYIFPFFHSIVFSFFIPLICSIFPFVSSIYKKKASLECPDLRCLLGFYLFFSFLIPDFFYSSISLLFYLPFLHYFPSFSHLLKKRASLYIWSHFFLFLIRKFSPVQYFILSYFLAYPFIGSSAV